MCMGGQGSDPTLQLQADRQTKLNQGTTAIDKAFAGFTPDFYGQRRQAYEDYATPQLGQQYRDTQQQLGFKLANQGIMHSSAATNLQGSLNQANLLGRQGIANEAMNQTMALQGQVANQKNALTGQLALSLNPTSTALNSANLAAQTAAPSSFQPIGQLFNNWSNTYLANRQAIAYAPYGGSVQPGVGNLLNSSLSYSGASTPGNLNYTRG